MEGAGPGGGGVEGLVLRWGVCQGVWMANVISLFLAPCMHSLYLLDLLYFSVDGQGNLFMAPCVHFPYFTVFTEWVGSLGGYLGVWMYIS